MGSWPAGQGGSTIHPVCHTTHFLKTQSCKCDQALHDQGPTGTEGSKRRGARAAEPTRSRCCSSFLMVASAFFSSFSEMDSWLMRKCSAASCSSSSASLFTSRSLRRGGGRRACYARAATDAAPTLAAMCARDCRICSTSARDKPVNIDLKNLHPPGESPAKHC